MGDSTAAGSRSTNVNCRGHEVSSSFCRMGLRKKKTKQVKPWRNHNLSFPTGPFPSNGSAVRQHGDADTSSKDGEDVLSRLDVGLHSKNEWNWHDKPDHELLNSSYPYSGEDVRQVDVTSSSVGKIVIVNLVDGISSHQEHLNDLHAGYYPAAKKKGKVILKSDTIQNAVHAKRCSCYNRAAPLSRKGRVTMIDKQASPSGSYRSTGMRNVLDIEKNPLQNLSPANSCIHMEELSSCCLPECGNESDIGGKHPENTIFKSPPIPTNHHRSNATVGAFPDPSVVSRRHDSLRKYINGKRKSSSSVSNCGETSYSIFPQKPAYPPHAEALNLKLDTSFKDGCDGTPIDVDKLYPEVRWGTQRQSCEHSCNSFARASQIESDERFARELQEQFDSEIAELTEIAEREGSAAKLYSCSEQSSFYDTSSPSTENAAMDIRNFVYGEMCPEALFDEVRNFHHELDLETRLDFLEAMDDFLEDDDMFEYGDISFHQYSDETEYEIQLELDESSHQNVGSSESRINSLPLSVVQVTNDREACPICLEIPAVGQTIRHLPCLHKFHKECIDTWLKRRPSCPVCKSRII